MNWQQMVKPKEYRGLDLGNVKDWNLALLAKWLWQFATNKGVYANPSFLIVMGPMLMAGTIVKFFLPLIICFGKILFK